MASGWYRASVTIPVTGGLPADSAVNVWSFRNVNEPVDPAVDAAAVVTTLDNFYSAISGFIASTMDIAHCAVKIFNLQDTAPRVPLLESEFSAGAVTTGGKDLPNEVAMCLSFRGAPGSGLNARRRRGRIYLGPLQGSSVDEHTRPPSGLTTTVMAAVASHLTPPAGGDLEWCVYSPYTHHGVPIGGDINERDGSGDLVYPEVPGNLFASFTPVSVYWMDDAWDTQRRRGLKETSRTTASV